MSDDHSHEVLPEPRGEGDEIDVSPETVDLLAAALRADQADLDAYSKVLLTSLVGTLPEGMLEVSRERSLSDRAARRPGRVVAIRAHLGEETLELVASRGGLTGTVARNVRGVAISRREVDLDAWTRLFAAGIARLANESASARAALGRLLGAE